MDSEIFTSQGDLKTKVDALITLEYDFKLERIAPSSLPNYSSNTLYTGEYYRITILGGHE